MACAVASPFLSKVPSISPSGPVTFHARLPVGDSAAGISLTAKLVGVIGLAAGVVVGAAGVIVSVGAVWVTSPHIVVSKSPLSVRSTHNLAFSEFFAGLLPSLDRSF